MQTKTLVAQLTPRVPAGIATIALSGPDSIAIACSRLRFKAKGGVRRSLQLQRVYFGTWQFRNESDAQCNDDKQSVAAEHVVVCRTDEDQVEVHCHGGRAICQAILADFVEAGASQVSIAEWTKDLTSPLGSSARQDLVHATTDRVASTLLDQANGALESEIQSILQGLAACQDTGALVTRLKILASRATFGLKLVDGWKVVLVGPPNAGKSSLINAIVGQDRLIVHAEEGTTRDWTQTQITLHGWPIALTDTAGIRPSTDHIELEGIAKSQERLDAADLLVVVADAERGWQALHEELMQHATPKIVCWNKADLNSDANCPQVNPLVKSSVKGSPGIGELVDAIATQLFCDAPPPGAAVPFREQHRQTLQTAIELLRQDRIAEASAALVRMLRG